MSYIQCKTCKRHYFSDDQHDCGPAWEIITSAHEDGESDTVYAPDAKDAALVWARQIDVGEHISAIMAHGETVEVRRKDYKTSHKITIGAEAEPNFYITKIE